jgi:alpha-tubulin suppressor-like RCC1 family protein
VYLGYHVAGHSVGAGNVEKLFSISRVSVDSAGSQANGDSYYPSFSLDGRYVAFQSNASNLVAGDTNGASDIFVYDRHTGATERISVDSSGNEATGGGGLGSDGASISGYGRYVVFRSDADNLVTGDNNGVADIFVHDRQTGATVRVSVDSVGNEGNGECWMGKISSDGNIVAFQSRATNLDPGDSTVLDDIYVYDRQSGDAEWVSKAYDGSQGNGVSEFPDLNVDGRFVAFQSDASNLVTGDTNAFKDIFVRDRQTGVTERVSVDSLGAQSDGNSYQPSISSDGRYVAFWSDADNLVTGDTNGVADVFVHDRQTGTTERVSVSTLGAEGDLASNFGTISADGNIVAFQSDAHNLVPGVYNTAPHIYVHNRQTGSTMLVSVNSMGEDNDYISQYPFMSPDGSWVGFNSPATNLVPNDTNGVNDVFVARTDTSLIKAVHVIVDNVAPSSDITDPLDGATLSGSSYTVTGTAGDGTGSGVQNVEVSTDGGTNWLPATDTSGDGSWSSWLYIWTYASDGSFALLSRSTDNAGNVETPGPAINVTVTRPSETVLAWGDNRYGEVGDGTTMERHAPVQVGGLSGVTAVGGGLYYTAALKSDGTVRAWGSGEYSKLGNQSGLNSPTPVTVIGLTDVVAVACGNDNTVALKADGTVWSWGGNGHGQFGNGTYTNSVTPVQASGLTGVIAIATGHVHTAALKSDGTVWTWGDNASGQLGDGTTTDRTAPVQVNGLNGVVAIAVGNYYTVALKYDGTVWAWGNNSCGFLLGSGAGNYSATPVQKSGIADVVAISAGNAHIACLKSDGTVWTWGDNGHGQLGNGTTTTSSTPVQASGLTDVVAVAAGGQFTVAMKSDGTVWDWGYDYYGQLGDGITTDSTTPVQVNVLTGVDAIAAGETHSVALGGTYTPPPDTIPPTSSITAPLNGTTFAGPNITVTGWASDAWSAVQSVEVSVDGGLNWQQATDTSGNGSWEAWSYNWTLPPLPGNYTIKSRATDSSSNVEVPGAGVRVTIPSSGSPELVHYDWDAWLTNGDCGVCHVTTSTFLNADFRQGPGFCRSCHNAAAPAHDRDLLGTRGHSMMVNVTSGGARIPTYGDITTAEYDNRIFAHLMDGDKVVCVTCHNPMRKTEDMGRVWEYTTTSDDLTYTLQHGGWAGYGSLEPRVYRDTSLWSGPTYVKNKKDYLVDASEYTFNEYSGTITFNAAQEPTDYVYVTLDYPYLRASNADNTMCSDCHTEATHRGINCLTCHTAHNTDNLGGVRGVVRAPDRVELPVVFLRQTGINSFADGDTTYDGICEVCHTQTLYYRRDGSGFVNHSGGFDYSGTDCTACHSHTSGFER